MLHCIKKVVKPKKIKIKNLFVFLLFIILIPFISLNSVNADLVEFSPEQIQRFGITIPYLSGDYVGLVKQTNATSALTWRSDDNNEWQDENIDFVHVIRVNDTAFTEEFLQTTLPNLVLSNIGEVWVIGNEPDRDIQDGVTPEVYAERYYKIAIRIRNLDPSAKLGFGSVVQPTPIRIRYLERALNHLSYLSCGNRDAAMDLIDIWSIHLFILNEELDGWGAGIPVGLEDDVSDAFLIPINRISDTHSIEIFSQWVKDFREWLYFIGEQQKPLWITEYGSLLPPIDPPPPDETNYINVSDEITSQYMIDTFDFMLSTIDTTIGFEPDGYHLVQRWYWYSLNDYRYHFGGTLFDPDDYYSPTLVGQEYISYTNNILSNPLSGNPPTIFRQSPLIYSVIYDSFLTTYNYPYEICFRTQLPLVIK